MIACSACLATMNMPLTLTASPALPTMPVMRLAVRPQGHGSVTYEDKSPVPKRISPQVLLCTGVTTISPTSPGPSCLPVVGVDYLRDILVHEVHARFLAALVSDGAARLGHGVGLVGVYP